MTADIHFSPLALTHALPFLPLAQGDIDYQVDRRSEPGLIDELLAEPTTKVVLTRGGLVAVPRGQGELVDYENVKMRLATLPGAYVSAELARYPEAVAMFLGSYVGARGESVVAVDITRVPEAGVPGVGGIAGVGGAVGGVLGTQDSGTVDGALGKNGISGGAAAGIRQPGNAKGNGGVAAAKIAGPLGVPDSAGQGADDAFDDSVGAPVQPLAPKPTLLQQAVTRFDWVDLRGFAPHSNAREAMEETGIKLGEVRYLGSQPWPFPASLMMAFKAHAITTDVRVDGEETMTARWVTRDEYTAELIAGRMAAPGRATIARYMIEEWLGREL